MLSTDLEQVALWRQQRAAVAAADERERARLIHDAAQGVRRSVVRTIDAARAGHIGGDLSVTDILTTLYLGVLEIDPADPTRRDRDRFILSKGHCAAALYSVLAHSGYFPTSELATFMAPMSALNGHPNRTKVPGVETNTGPLGHGLPVAVGEALGLRLQGLDRRVYVVTGDGEMQEGSNWEAIMSAAHYRLGNLTLVVDRNRLQQGARTEDTNALDPLAERLAAFGCEVREIDGHDVTQLLGAFAPSTTGRPVAVVANTIKGKGVSFMEDRVEWHHKVPTAEQVTAALAELGEQGS
ncbi:transketolase [Pseudactinotalea suaedae]|uniref:transketolase n=1 Tax=Pseudactinotalea suaedae TaxID=1524924 RepID=UPI0012E1CA95|nr:transketolase [Pseudactinotalea suaedae]